MSHDRRRPVLSPIVFATDEQLDMGRLDFGLGAERAEEIWTAYYGKAKCKTWPPSLVCRTDRCEDEPVYFRVDPDTRRREARHWREGVTDVSAEESDEHKWGIDLSASAFELIGLQADVEYGYLTTGGRRRADVLGRGGYKPIAQEIQVSQNKPQALLRRMHKDEEADFVSSWATTPQSVVAQTLRYRFPLSTTSSRNFRDYRRAEEVYVSGVRSLARATCNARLAKAEWHKERYASRRCRGWHFVPGRLKGPDERPAYRLPDFLSRAAQPIIVPTRWPFPYGGLTLGDAARRPVLHVHWLEVGDRDALLDSELTEAGATPALSESRRGLTGDELVPALQWHQSPAYVRARRQSPVTPEPQMDDLCDICTRPFHYVIHWGDGICYRCAEDLALRSMRVRRAGA